MALDKLVAIARGDWSDPERVPDGDPPGECDWGECDEPAAAWRWSEDHGGWLPVCAHHEGVLEHGQGGAAYCLRCGCGEPPMLGLCPGCDEARA